MRKSIFQALSDTAARAIKCEKGVKVWTHTAGQFGGVITGEVLSVWEDPHGTLILVKNEGKLMKFNGYLARFGENATAVEWPVIPVWVSKCGQSGIIAMWKDEAVRDLVSYEQFYLDMEASFANHRREIEVQNAMAL